MKPRIDIDGVMIASKWRRALPGGNPRWETVDNGIWSRRVECDGVRERIESRRVPGGIIETETETRQLVEIALAKKGAKLADAGSLLVAWQIVPK